MMPPPRTHRFSLILAAVDFSRQSAKALRYAVALARAGGGRVVAVHVIEPVLAGAAAQAYDERALIRDTTAGVAKFVASTAGAASAPGIQCLAVAGAPRQTLAATARRLHADVLVMGTHGRGDVDKAFFGSVAKSLLRRYPETVMVIPPGCPDPPASWPGLALAAVGHGRSRRALISSAARMAALFGAWLSVVDVETPARQPAWRQAGLILLPLPAADRLRTFRQGPGAHRVIREAHRPVLVMHAGRRIGHVAGPRKAAWRWPGSEPPLRNARAPSHAER